MKNLYLVGLIFVLIMVLFGCGSTSHKEEVVNVSSLNRVQKSQKREVNQNTSKVKKGKTVEVTDNGKVDTNINQNTNKFEGEVSLPRFNGTVFKAGI